MNLSDIGCPVPNSQLVNVGVEDLVHEPDTGRLVRELLWQIDVDLPHSLGERRLTVSACMH